MMDEYTVFDEILEILGIFSIPILIYLFVIIFRLKKWSKKKRNTYRDTSSLPSKSEMASDISVIFFESGFISSVPMLFLGMGGAYGILFILAFATFISLVTYAVIYILADNYIRKLQVKVSSAQTEVILDSLNAPQSSKKGEYLKKIFIISLFIFTLGPFLYIGLRVWNSFFFKIMPPYEISQETCEIVYNTSFVIGDVEKNAANNQVGCINRKLFVQAKTLDNIIDCNWVNKALQTSIDKSREEYILSICTKLQDDQKKLIEESKQTNIQLQIGNEIIQSDSYDVFYNKDLGITFKKPQDYQSSFRTDGKGIIHGVVLYPPENFDITKEQFYPGRNEGMFIMIWFSSLEETRSELGAKLSTAKDLVDYKENLIANCSNCIDYRRVLLGKEQAWFNRYSFATELKQDEQQYGIDFSLSPNASVLIETLHNERHLIITANYLDDYSEPDQEIVSTILSTFEFIE